MKESKLLGKLLPSHPDILPIFEGIRNKYNIPEIDSVTDDFGEIFYADDEIDWDAVRKDIDRHVRNPPDLLPDIAKNFSKALYTTTNIILNLKTLQKAISKRLNIFE